MPDDRLAALCYEFCYAISFTWTSLGCSMRFDGRHNMPRTGPALVIANHQSYLDPVLIGVASPRHLCWLARKSLFRQPMFTRLIRILGAVPVDQDGVAKEGIRAVLNQLEKGKAVVVFPEGERTPDGERLPLKPGIQLIIKKAQVPVIPIGIAGAFDVLPRSTNLPRFSPLFLPVRRATIAVSIGTPIDGRRLAEKSREEVMEELDRELRKIQAHAERLRRKR